MRLEDLTVTLRPRQPWEAVDLGCSLVRRDYGRVLLLWLITVLPLWGLVTALMWKHPLWFSLVIWWLKPLYDRVPLFYLSRAAFGSKPTLKETLKAWPGLWSRFLLSALIFRRFSFIRGFALPVWILEGQRGKAVTQRIKALRTVTGSGGVTQTMVFLKLELAVYLGLIVLTNSIGPSSAEIDLVDLLFNQTALIEDNQALIWFYNILYLFAITLVEPFYVGAGFGLYLNARTHLEGWDIELTFRRIAQRLRAAAAIAIFSFGLLLHQNLHAQSAPVPQDKVEATLAEIYAQPEFEEHKKTISLWVPDRPEPSAKTGSEIPSWIRDVLIVIGYACLAFFVFWFIRWLILNKHLLKWKGAMSGLEKRVPTPRVIMGLDIARESLPNDIILAAKVAWAEGHPHDALSLIYRGALSRLVEQKGLPIHDSDTEDDCLSKVTHLGDGKITPFFRQLTLLWIAAAYASEIPSEQAFQQLCAAWPFDQNLASTPTKLRRFAPVAILLFILPWVAGCKGRWVEDTIELGYRGKARINPFLATQQLLEEFGHECESQASLKKLPSADESVIFVAAENGISEGQAQPLLEWVSRGGHVVYLVAGAGPYNDWGITSALSFLKHAGSEGEKEPVLDALGVSVESLSDLFSNEKKLRQKLRGEETESAEETKPQEVKNEDEGAPFKAEEIATAPGEIQIGTTTHEVDFPQFIKLSLQRPLIRGEYQSGSQDSTPMLSLKKGLGRVTFIAHARPLRNRYLNEKDHGRWLLAMMGDAPQRIYFITTTQKGFWDLLWERAWMLLIGLGVITLIWLWMNIPRFGPLKRVELHETKHFVDHIGALGQFFYRLNRSDILLTAAADAVRVRAFKKHPHLINQQEESLVKVLTDLSHLPPDQISAALESRKGKISSQELTRRLIDLKTLRESLA